MGRKRTYGYGVTESRDVDSYVSGTPQAGSRDQVRPTPLHRCNVEIKIKKR